jgi:YD repeat-containing protein
MVMTNWFQKRLVCVLALTLILGYWGGSANALTINYTYDTAGRLTKAHYGGDKIIQFVYDNNGNLLERIMTSNRLPGDVNGDGGITLADVLDALKVQAGEKITVNPLADVNNDQKIGLPEAEYVLQKAGGLRE